MTEARVAIITGIPTPYREPVFAELATRPGIKLSVCYCAKAHADVAWESVSTDSVDTAKYGRRFPKNWTPQRWQRLPLIGYTNVGVWPFLWNYKPDFVVIYGYTQLAHWLTFFYCLFFRIPFALRSDSNIYLQEKPSLLTQLRTLLVFPIVKSASAFLCVGTANRQFWKSLGASEQKLFDAPFAIDRSQFETAAQQRSECDTPRFLYVGRLIPRKGVDELIEAFNHIAAKGDATLTIVGDGPEKRVLMQMQTEKAARLTTWVGRIENHRVCEFMAAADVLVLPSKYEPWGLVVNEAMAAGLPVIASRKVGAAVDLIRTGVTGLMLDNAHHAELIEAMRFFCDNPIRCSELGQNARNYSRSWNFVTTIDGFVRAIVANVRQGKSKARESETGTLAYSK